MIKIFKKIRITLCIAFALFAGIFASLCAYSCAKLPDTLYVSEGDSINIDALGPMCRFFDVDAKASDIGELGADGRMRSGGNAVTVSFLGIDIKDIGVSVIRPDCVVPCGNTVGIRIYAGGLVVLRITSFVSEEGIQARPWAGTGIKKGDIIRKANGEQVDSITSLGKIVNNCDGAVTLELERQGEILNASLTPHREQLSGNYKLGLIVRDSMAGIGTMTYYNPSDGTFGALGHPIEDSDTGDVFPLDHGSLERAEVINVVKGRRGMPGEIHGVFAGSEPIGSITTNCSIGVYGKAEVCPVDISGAIPVASRSEIAPGAATLQCTVGDKGVQQYDIEIEKLLSSGSESAKSMVVHITDSRLISATGGIVQGMSGSPLIQNGKLIGAVTHVFVNDPTRGYGIFIENMLAEAEKIK